MNICGNQKIVRVYLDMEYYHMPSKSKSTFESMGPLSTIHMLPGKKLLVLTPQIFPRKQKLIHTLYLPFFKTIWHSTDSKMLIIEQYKNMNNT